MTCAPCWDCAFQSFIWRIHLYIVTWETQCSLSTLGRRWDSAIVWSSVLCRAISTHFHSFTFIFLIGYLTKLWLRSYIASMMQWMWRDSGMRIGRGNRSTRRQPFAVSRCPLHFPDDLTWPLPLQWEAGDQTAWVMAQPACKCEFQKVICSKSHLNCSNLKPTFSKIDVDGHSTLQHSGNFM
jgi:hypothetical protein